MKMYAVDIDYKFLTEVIMMNNHNMIWQKNMK